ncbi:MAG: glycoside hydrolase family 75 protein [Acidobacteriia bacterium]|nr:glycoside hydrolase family 75 protein [Terriglobia bacterium]
MAIDADGAPNAYDPHDRGLDRLANARRRHHWIGVATDKRGHPLVQKRGRYRGYYVSTTSLQNAAISNPAKPAKYVNATKVPYIVLPPEVAQRFGIALGDLAVVINQRNEQPVVSYAIYADTGPHGKIGEGSIALAEALGLPSSPRTGRTEDGILYVVFPGSGLGPGRLRKPEEITRATAELYQQWGGAERLQACSFCICHPDLSNRPVVSGESKGC